jgi:peptide/nickel transport system substrate-binding protein
MIISKEYHENNNTKQPVGTGPYKLIDYKQDEYITLERFNDYWREQPDIDLVKFKIIENSLDRKNALINKTIDIADTIYPEYFNELSLIENITIKNVNTPVVYFLSFDIRKNSDNWNDGINPFSYIEVRKALYHAINITEIIDKHLYGFGTPISQYVSPLIYGYNPDIERLPYNLDIAKNLMNEVGFKSGFNVSLDCPDDNLMKNISLDISKQLHDINITTKLNVLSILDWFTKIQEKNTIFYILGWIPSGIDGGEIFDYFLRTIDYENNIGTYNAGYYSNAEVDEIGEKIIWTMDSRIRQKLIQQGFLISMNDVVGIPLFSIQWIYGISDEFIWNPRPDLNIRVEDIKIKT